MKILYIISSYNIYGGTPKKTLDLMKFFKDDASLYVYNNSYPEFKEKFKKTGGSIYEGFYRRNIFKHLKKLLYIIDKEKIDIVQTQFSMGETLGYFLKLLRPKVKLLVAFVGPLKPAGFRARIVAHFYKKADVFVYISKYVKREKTRQFPILKTKSGVIIYNGTGRRQDIGKPTIEMKKFSLLDVAGLIDLKNITILIEALEILVYHRNMKNIHLYIAGNGPQRKYIENMIGQYSLQNNIFLLGYQSNVGKLINDCDVFLHPAYAEGFGIAVAEAMHAEKPIIVSNAGALPELIENGVSGVVVDPFDAHAWAISITNLISDKSNSFFMAHNARLRAQKYFSLNIFSHSYNRLYKNLLT